VSGSCVGVLAGMRVDPGLFKGKGGEESDSLRDAGN